MAEALKRWNGTEWVTVALVNVFGGGGSEPMNNYIIIEMIIGVPFAM